MALRNALADAQHCEIVRFVLINHSRGDLVVKVRDRDRDGVGIFLDHMVVRDEVLCRLAAAPDGKARAETVIIVPEIAQHAHDAVLRLGDRGKIVRGKGARRKQHGAQRREQHGGKPPSSGAAQFLLSHLVSSLTDFPAAGADSPPAALA